MVQSLLQLYAIFATLQSRQNTFGVKALTWLVFTYSLPATERSSPRVAIWRKLTRTGAINPRGGVHILPSRDECLESFHWLSREVQEMGGDCLLMRVDSFEGMTNSEVIGLFQQKSDAEYRPVNDELTKIEKAALGKMSADKRRRLYADLQKLRKTQQEILRTDFFNSPAGARIVSTFARLDRLLSEDASLASEIPKLSASDFVGRVWVTRPRPHVDRLSSVWLIRRFIDPKASIIYKKSPEIGELGFDLKEGGAFGHVGKFCTFETLLASFGLEEPALWKLGEIVHEIDLRDGIYTHPEIAGIDLILKGWLLAGLEDGQLEVLGTGLFEGIFQSLKVERLPKKLGRVK